MFRHIYEAGASVFLLQGVLLIPLLIAGRGRLVPAKCADRRRWRRRSGVIAKHRDLNGRSRSLKALPKLAPLSCTACGGALALDVDSTTCVSCGTSFPPPPDYAATISLRRRLKAADVSVGAGCIGISRGR